MTLSVHDVVSSESAGLSGGKPAVDSDGVSGYESYEMTGC